MPESVMTIDAYIAQFPPDIAGRLNALRETIRAAAPEATEKFSWQMPTFYLHGNLVHFAAHKNHIGFYPGADGIELFKDKLGEFRFSKGAVQFPNDKPLPLALIREITAFRAGQNLEAAAQKPVRKKTADKPGDNERQA